MRLLTVSNERLELVFRQDDPTRDSPLATVDPVPVLLNPLTPTKCRCLVERRLAASGLALADYADLCTEPQQPSAILARCAARFETMRQSGSEPPP